MAVSSLPSEDEQGGDAIFAEINITPLTDIFLVLLIIFMVTSSVMQSQGKQIDLPDAAVSETTPKGVSVTVTSDGEIQIGDRIVPDAEIYAALKEALDASDEKLVILRGDKAVLLGQAVHILDMAQQAGAKGIGLATNPTRRVGGS